MKNLPACYFFCKKVMVEWKNKNDIRFIQAEHF